MNYKLRRKMAEVGAKPERRFLPIELKPSAVNYERRIYCKHYELCLDHACECDWTSWSCNSCPVKDSITLDQMREDAFEIIKFLRENRIDWS